MVRPALSLKLLADRPADLSPDVRFMARHLFMIWTTRSGTTAGRGSWGFFYGGAYWPIPRRRQRTFISRNNKLAL
jgi:hypothetical protein